MSIIYIDCSVELGQVLQELSLTMCLRIIYQVNTKIHATEIDRQHSLSLSLDCFAAPQVESLTFLQLAR